MRFLWKCAFYFQIISVILLFNDAVSPFIIAERRNSDDDFAFMS